MHPSRVTKIDEDDPRAMSEIRPLLKLDSVAPLGRKAVWRFKPLDLPLDSTNCLRQRFHFLEILHSRRGLGAGGGVEGGGVDGGQGFGGVFGDDAAGEDDREMGVRFDELGSGEPVDGLAGAAVEAGGVGV